MSQSSKRRFCPAVQREITSQECGEHRNSNYQCPAICQFNPFAPSNYSHLLELEGQLDKVMFKALVSEPVHGDQAQRRFEKGGFDNQGFSNVVLWEMFHRRDDAGLTFVQRWENRGLSELKNDFRCLIRAKSGMFLALLEIQRVIDEDSIECLDLFQPSLPPFLIFDRSAAKRACRFDVLLGQCYRLPHFTRFFGTAIPIPFIGTMEPVAIVRDLVTHLGGPAELPGLQLWALEHLNKFADALWATLEARRKASLAKSDLKICKAVYRLAAPYSECRAALDAVPDIAPDTLSKEYSEEGFSSARVWFAPHATGKNLNFGREALGTVLLGQALWRLEAITQARMDQLRALFESALGARVKLEGLRTDDLHSVEEAKRDRRNPLVSPTFLEDLPQLSISSSRISPVVAQAEGPALQERLLRSSDEEFLTNSIPALGGVTPGAAAQDSQQVARLRRLLKQRINGADKDSLANGGNYDPAWLAAALGQHDLCLPPPPPRPRLEVAGSSELEPEAEESPSDLPPAPPLPLHLDADVAERRINDAVKAFPNFLDLREAAFEAGCTWVDDVEQMTGSKLSDKEFEAVAVALIESWFAMVPVGFSGPEISLDRITARLERISNKLREHDQAEILPSSLKSEFQCHIGGTAILTFLDLCKDSKLLKKKTASKTIFLLLVILSFIDEMHLALAGAPNQ